jgi:hypothetical protein
MGTRTWHERLRFRFYGTNRVLVVPSAAARTVQEDPHRPGQNARRLRRVQLIQDLSQQPRPYHHYFCRTGTQLSPLSGACCITYGNVRHQKRTRRSARSGCIGMTRRQTLMRIEHAHRVLAGSPRNHGYVVTTASGTMEPLNVLGARELALMW